MNKVCFGLLLSLICFNTFSQNVTKFKALESQRVLLDKHGQFLVAMQRTPSSVETVVDLSKSTISFIDKGKTDDYSIIKTFGPWSDILQWEGLKYDCMDSHSQYCTIRILLYPDRNGGTIYVDYPNLIDSYISKKE